MLPEDILNKIMLFNSHPVADIMKESSIFKYLQLREISIINARQVSQHYTSNLFDIGCADGWDNNYNANKILTLSSMATIEWGWDKVADCAKCYDIGFMHTLVKLNDDDDFDYKFRYSIKPINIVGTNQRVNHFLKTKKVPCFIDYVR